MPHVCYARAPTEARRFAPSSISLPRARPHATLDLQHLAGNHALARLQTKLRINQPGDPYELEADRVADQVMRMPDASIQRKCACGGTSDDCQEGGGAQVQRTAQPGASASATAPTWSAPAALGLPLDSPGEPLDTAARTFVEPRLGVDLGAIRIHRDSRAAESAHDFQALAYTVGPHVVFGAGQYAPDTAAGRRLLVHELVHTLQQRAVSAPRDHRNEDRDEGLTRRSESIPVGEMTSGPIIARVSAAMCSSDCVISDGSGGPTGEYLITVHADREGPFLLVPLTSKVGHSWVELIDTTGTRWSYGFWPESGFDPSNPRADVDGCVHHPDVIHRPTASRTFKVDAARFSRAKARAVAICLLPPKYNLFGLQCTEFARQILEAADLAPMLGFGLIWESPNALNAWIRGHSLMLGASMTTATTAPAGGGTVTAELVYQHQFLSLLGNSVRLHWMARGELGQHEQSVATGVGFDVTSHQVFLPRAYVFGGGIAGVLPPGGPAAARPGAGLTAGAGLTYDIDQLVTVGVEYNMVKDLVNKDPELHRLMLSAKIPLF